MVAKYYKDFYGGHSVITEKRDGTFRLQSFTSHGRKSQDGCYKSLTGARWALSRITDGIYETTKEGVGIA